MSSDGEQRDFVWSSDLVEVNEWTLRYLTHIIRNLREYPPDKHQLIMMAAINALAHLVEDEETFTDMVDLTNEMIFDQMMVEMCTFYGKQS